MKEVPVVAAAAAAVGGGGEGVEAESGLEDARGGGGGGTGAGFGFVGEMSARWSDHYKANPREPENTELAWWVKGAVRGGAK